MRRTCSLTLTAAVLLLSAASARATFTWGVVAQTPMVGIAPGQTARFNAVMKQPGPSQGGADPVGRNPGPVQCDGTLTIVNGDGGALTSSARVTLTPGHAAFIDLPFDRAAAAGADVSAPGAGRVMVRGAADFVCPEKDPGPTQVPADLISVSLEGFDTATGAARVFLQSGTMNVSLDGPMNAPIGSPVNGPLNGPLNTPGSSPMNTPLNGPMNTPMFGVAPGQTARFSAVMTNPGPTQCDADVTFVNGDGAPLATTRLTLTPEHAAFFDLPVDPAGATGAGAVDRVMVGLTVTVGGCSTNPGPTIPISGAVSVEVFDSATGIASVTVNPVPIGRVP